MPSWKKVIVSGSDASLASLSTSGAITGSVIKSIGAISGSEVSASTFYGDGSNLTGLATSADVSGSWGGALSGSLDIISGSAVDSGSAIYHDTQDERWAVAKGVAADGTAVTPTAYVTTTVTANHNPDTTSGSYGVGEQWVNTTTDDIWIRVE